MAARNAASMRIGTWNLDAKWSARHCEFLESLQCDVLLLTEVPIEVDLTGMVDHHSNQRMARDESWAATTGFPLGSLRVWFSASTDFFSRW